MSKDGALNDGMEGASSFGAEKDGIDGISTCEDQGLKATDTLVSLPSRSTHTPSTLERLLARRPPIAPDDEEEIKRDAAGAHLGRVKRR